MSFLCFSQHSLLVVELIRYFGCVLFCERSKLDLFCLVQVGRGLYLRKRLFFVLSLYLQFIPLYFNQCLFFHGEVVFLR